MTEIFNIILVHPIIWVISFVYNITEMIGLPSYGLAIILFTLVIKIILYPLTVKQIKSMKLMQDLQPKMKQIQEKYKDNKQMQQQKMMEFYKETGFNPLAGCFPLLVQMPILIAVFWALREFPYLVTPSFLYLADISQPDPIYALPILSAATTWYSTKQSQGNQAAPAEGAMAQQQKIMLIFMPLFIGYISMTFPAGLVLYWVTSNIVQIAQQWWLMRDSKKA